MKPNKTILELRTNSITLKELREIVQFASTTEADHVKLFKDGGRRASYFNLEGLMEMNDSEFKSYMGWITISLVKKLSKGWADIAMPYFDSTQDQKTKKVVEPKKKKSKKSSPSGKTGFMVAVDELLKEGEFTTRQIGEKLSVSWNRDLKKTKAVVRARMRTLIKRDQLEDWCVPNEDESSRKISFIG